MFTRKDNDGDRFMNPWKQSLLEFLRDILRFALWIAFVINGLMVGVFSIAFCFHFLDHLWSWLVKHVFTGSW